MELMDETTRNDATAAVQSIIDKGRHSARFECGLLLPDEGVRRCRVSIGRSADPTDGEPNLLIHLEDISVEHALALARDEAEQRFRAAFDDAPVGMALLDLEGRFLQVNDAFADMLGYSMSTLVGRRMAEVTHVEHIKADKAGLADVIAGIRPSHVGETRLLRINGEPLWVLFQTTVIREGDQPRYVLTHVQDITERKSYEGQLRYMADHDPLTGLFNRRRFEEELQRQLSLVSRYGPAGALLVLDLDHFKSVNDTLGHHAGDRLIVSVAEMLRRRLRETDVLARLGGDEFAVLLPRADRAEAEHLAQVIVEAVRTEVEVANGDRGRRVTTSVGVTLLDDPVAHVGGGRGQRRPHDVRGQGVRPRPVRRLLAVGRPGEPGQGAPGLGRAHPARPRRGAVRPPRPARHRHPHRRHDAVRAARADARRGRRAAPARRCSCPWPSAAGSSPGSTGGSSSGPSSCSRTRCAPVASWPSRSTWPGPPSPILRPSVTSNRCCGAAASTRPG